jgi:hypothetical protein
MTKIKKVGHRGTEAHYAEVGNQNWSGDAYRKEELSKMEKIPKNLTMHLGRGVRTTKAGDLPKPRERPSTEGMTRITSRGTNSRKSRNIGSQ